MQTLATALSRGLRWAFPLAPPEDDVSIQEQVTQAMSRHHWWHWEPRKVAGELMVRWSTVDEELWREEYIRCAGCGCWMPAQNGGFCQGCLAF